MNVREHVLLAPFTTLGVGGQARFFIEAFTPEDVEEAIAFARKEHLPFFVLGGGSNVLVPDAGIPGVVIRMRMQHVSIEESEDRLVITADAGVAWDDIVAAAGTRGFFGIENLAGIPGTAAGAAVQNIGAYGAELSPVFAYADVIDTPSGVHTRITRDEAAFAYRTSFFKKNPNIVIIRVALSLSKESKAHILYPDVAKAHAAGVPLTTPVEIAFAIRFIRARKFPHGDGQGSAGSFFKNPVVSREAATSLCARFPGLPSFPQGKDMMKLPLAWILDHVLSLKGYAMGPVRLYEEQPLVIVAKSGATAADVDALACVVAARVQEATGIALEREVETFGIPR